MTARLVPEGVLTQPSRGWQARSATCFWGSALPALHGAAWRQGAASRRFAPVLAGDCAPFP